jgi:hypothetical protein
MDLHGPAKEPFSNHAVGHAPLQVEFLQCGEHLHTQTHTHTHKDTHTHTHTRKHAHTDTHTRTYIQIYI